MAPAVSASRSRIKPRVEKALAERPLRAMARSASARASVVFAGQVARPGAIVEGERGLRRELDGTRVVGDRAAEIEPLAPGIAAVDVGVGSAGIELDGLFEIRHGALVVVLGLPGAAPIVVSGRGRIELDRLVVVGDRAIEVALAPPGNAAIVERRGVARVDAQGVVVVGDGAVGVALVVEGVAAIVESDGKFWIELDRLIVVGDGAIEVALLIIGIAALVVGAGMLRIELQRLAESAMAWSRSPSRR